VAYIPKEACMASAREVSMCEESGMGSGYDHQRGVGTCSSAWADAHCTACIAKGPIISFSYVPVKAPVGAEPVLAESLLHPPLQSLSAA